MCFLFLRGLWNHATLADCGGPIKGQADLTSKQFLRIVDSLDVKPGEKVPLDEAMQQASEATLEISTCIP